MTEYLVERFLPGEPGAELERVARRAETSTAELRREGVAVRYLGSTLVPKDQTCFCLFDAPSGEIVGLANDRAGLAFERILEAITRRGDASEVDR